MECNAICSVRMELNYRTPAQVKELLGDVRTLLHTNTHTKELNMYVF